MIVARERLSSISKYLIARDEFQIANIYGIIISFVQRIFIFFNVSNIDPLSLLAISHARLIAKS